MSPPIQPNAITRSQVARMMGFVPQAVDKRIAAGKLEAFEYFGTVMVPMRSVNRWIREREKARAKQTAMVLDPDDEP